MLIKKYLRTSSNLFAENRLLKFVFIILLIMQIDNRMFLRKELYNQKVVVLPPRTSGNISIQGNKINKQSIIEYGWFFAVMVSHYTPLNIKEQLDNVLLYVAEDSYPKTKEAFDELVRVVKKSSTVSTFHPYSKIEVTEELIRVKGKYALNTGRKELDKGEKTINIKFKIKEGVVEIISIWEEKRTRSR